MQRTRQRVGTIPLAFFFFVLSRHPLAASCCREGVLSCSIIIGSLYLPSEPLYHLLSHPVSQFFPLLSPLNFSFHPPERPLVVSYLFMQSLYRQSGKKACHRRAKQ
ncbi:hypothetical protein BKA57DRAFT_453167 [Linnemannia elongata]|nr:hypothetical protein BKA57DRAFT_453167 [Linnemannia elongata]